MTTVTISVVFMHTEIPLYCFETITFVVDPGSVAPNAFEREFNDSFVFMTRNTRSKRPFSS